MTFKGFQFRWLKWLFSSHLKITRLVPLHFSWSHGIISFLGDRTSKIFLGFAMTSRADIQRESCHEESGSVVYLHLNIWVGLGPIGLGTYRSLSHSNISTIFKENFL